ncbi:LamG-like jellyroll fold domain-containing protein [Microbispora corallina]|nr:LamG-like jellyroll fold domain-containing protein [Microbispora corallina]
MAPTVAVADSASAAGAAADVIAAQRALDQAKASGQPVEVVSARTETTTTYANPDGFTFRLDQSTVPVRVARPDGSWEAPDATLVRQADGTLRPRAAVVDLTFSGGGDKPLVTIGRNGRTLSFSWPGSLPVPVLDGDSALYADVLPGVDLRMTAGVEGYHEVLVVKSAKAAADLRLKRITFGLSASGLRVGGTGAGGFSAVGADGQEVFSSPAAQMWDSLGVPAASAPSKTAPAAATPSVSGPSAPQPTSDAPGPGSRTATTPLVVGRDSVTVVPDTHLMAEQDPAAYPLYIDPDVALNSGVPERTLLRSDGYTSYGWGNGVNGEGDGYCGTWNGYYCGPGYTQRLYFQFTPGALRGKKVLSAIFRVTSPWAFVCDLRLTELTRTNNISSSTTWATRPTQLDMMVDRWFSAGRGSACDPDSPDAPIEFTDNPDETNENLTPTVQDFAAGKFAKLTLELRPHDETDASAWKRFKNNAVLSVNYVANPAMPTDVGIVSGSSAVCHTNSADPQVVSGTTPQVRGRPQTQPGGESQARLRVRWRVERLSGSTWSQAIGDVTMPASGFVGDNVLEPATLPALLTDVQYRLKALTLSYQDNQTSFLNTGYTAPCYFTIDATAPKAPTVALSTPYSVCLSDSCVAGGGPGVPGTVTFGPAPGDVNTAYSYRLSSDDSWHDLAAGATSTTLVPQVSGTYHLEARAKDRAGRWGASSTTDFLVAAGAGPVGQWHFDETGGAALDTSSTVPAEQDNATLSATGATRDDRGRRGLELHDDAGTPLATPVTDTGLTLDGTSGYAETQKPVIDVRASYTVSAWVRLGTSQVRTMGVLSQDDTTASPFYLSYAADGVDDWSMRVRSCTADTTCVWIKARSVVTPVPGVWTHLTGQYDAAAGKLSLYVNGVLQASVPATAPAVYGKPLQIGRDSWNGSHVDYFNGSIDEVSVWQRALTAQEILDQARGLDAAGYGDAELTAGWQAEGASGSTLADASGYGRTLTPAGGATLDGTALTLDGSGGYASTPGSVVDDRGSLTATARVQLNVAALTTHPAGYTVQVAGQPSADGSAWGLWFRYTGITDGLDDDGNVIHIPQGQWLFGRVAADGGFTGAVSPNDDPGGGSGEGDVQVTGVLDAQSGTVSLYLGANLQDTQPYTTLAGSGDFTAGRGHVGGAWGHYLPGRIEDLRVWTGAMTSSDQIAAVVGG